MNVLNRPGSSLPWKDTEILVIGDLMLDTYFFGRAKRISPEAPVPIVSVERTEFWPGGAGNVACNAAGLGSRVTVCGFLGNDRPGRLLRHALESHGAAVKAVWTSRRPTTEKTRIVASRQQLLRYDHESEKPPTPHEESLLWKRIGSSWPTPGCGCVVISDYCKGAVSAWMARQVIDEAGRRGLPALVDSKAGDYTPFENATMITPNEAEARRAVADPDSSLEQVGRLLLEKTRACGVVITQGEFGMTLFTPDSPPELLASTPTETQDVTGAGDTVAAVLALSLARKMPLIEAVRWANAAAGLAVRNPGTCVVKAQELIQFMHETNQGE